MKKSTAIIVISILAAAAIAGTALAAVTGARLDSSERYISDNYRHAFTELTAGVSDMSSALQKSVLITSAPLACSVCAEVYGSAQTAQMALGVLPLGAADLEKTSGFIGKAGDYAFALARKAGTGQSFSDEERENLRALSFTAAALASALKQIEEQLFAGQVTMDEFSSAMEKLDRSEGEIITETVGESMSVAEGEFPELPALIYDGPFSEHLDTAEPKLLAGMEEIDQSAGRRAAAKFLGSRPENVYPTSESAGRLPAFSYETQIKGDSVAVSLSKAGGVVYELLSSRRVENSELTAQEALDKAQRYLERRGYTGMRQSYYLISDNILTANYAFVQDGVVCYSDLVKVGVAMDDGGVVSFEAKGYVMNHVWRELPSAEIDAETAALRAPAGLEVLGTELTLIPTAGQYELLCYELECVGAAGERCLIYVNALSGEQEKVLLLLEDENGTLTI